MKRADWIDLAWCMCLAGAIVTTLAVGMVAGALLLATT